MIKQQKLIHIVIGYYNETLFLNIYLHALITGRLILVNLVRFQVSAGLLGGPGDHQRTISQNTHESEFFQRHMWIFDIDLGK